MQEHWGATHHEGSELQVTIPGTLSVDIPEGLTGHLGYGLFTRDKPGVARLGLSISPRAGLDGRSGPGPGARPACRPTPESVRQAPAGVVSSLLGSFQTEKAT